MNINDLNIKLSELPKGTVIEMTDSNGDTYEYELSADWRNPDKIEDSIPLNEVDSYQNVRIVSVPFEVAYHLATWLDNVYTKTGVPENLIIEAAVESKKTKHDAHISDRPKKG